MINRVYKGALHNGPGWSRFIKSEEVSPIKYGTFHYAATAGNPSLFGKGGAFSSYIEFEYYTSGGVTLANGDMLLYAQEWDVSTTFANITPSREQGINLFYVTEIKEKRDTIYILAYDMVGYKLNVDFSETLKANEANFPMSINRLCELVSDLTGVISPWTSPLLDPPARDNYWKYATVNYFYSPGITAKNIYNWIGEIVGYSLLALNSGDIAGSTSFVQTQYKTFSDGENWPYWEDADKYIVCPDDGTYTIDGNTAINAWYKESGLEIGAAFPAYDGVELVATNGKLLGRYYSTNPPTNVLRISNNAILENINTFANIYNGGVDTGVVGTYKDLAMDIFAHANIVSGMSTAKVRMFTFRCPYMIGSRMYCVDPNGNRYTVPIMSMDITEQEVVIGAYGYGDVSGANKPGSDDLDNTSSVASLWSTVNQINNNLGYATLLNGVAVNAGTVTTYLSRDISYYKWLIALWKDSNNNVRATAFFRFDDFFDANYISLFYVDSVNTQRWCELAFDTDTSVNVSASSNASGVVFLFGMRLTEVADAPTSATVNLVDNNGNQLVDHSGNALIATSQ